MHMAFQLIVLAVGRLCQLDESPEATETLSNCGTREQYQQQLTLSCRPGEPGMITWTPDDNTPNTVYYEVRPQLGSFLSSFPVCKNKERSCPFYHMTNVFLIDSGRGRGVFNRKNTFCIMFILTDTRDKMD